MKGQLTGPSAAQEAKWQAEEDMRTLLRAKEIQKDSKRMAAVRKMAQQKMAEMKLIATSTTTK